MKVRYMTGCALLTAMLLCTACASSGKKQESQYRTNDPTPEQLAAMTPEQRQVHEDLRRAREQYRARQKIDSSKKKRVKQPQSQKEEGGLFSNLWKRNSVEKRKRLGDTSRPVLLNQTKSDVMPWKTSGPRSEQLHDKYRNSNRYND